jgi:hypothetical protein
MKNKQSKEDTKKPEVLRNPDNRVNELTTKIKQTIEEYLVENNMSYALIWGVLLNVIFEAYQDMLLGSEK